MCASQKPPGFCQPHLHHHPTTVLVVPCYEILTVSLLCLSSRAMRSLQCLYSARRPVLREIPAYLHVLSCFFNPPRWYQSSAILSSFFPISAEDKQFATLSSFFRYLQKTDNLQCFSLFLPNICRRRTICNAFLSFFSISAEDKTICNAFLFFFLMSAEDEQLAHTHAVQSSAL